MSRGCENYMMHTKLYFSKLNSLKLYFSHCIFPNCIFPYCIFPKGIFLKFTCQTIYWSNRNKNMYIISPAKRMPHNRFYSKFFGNNLEIKHATLYKNKQIILHRNQNFSSPNIIKDSDYFFLPQSFF